MLPVALYDGTECVVEETRDFGSHVAVLLSPLWTDDDSFWIRIDDPYLTLEA